MVCDECARKMKGVACSDPWRSGARSRSVAENKALARRAAAAPYDRRCKLCKEKIAQGVYCQACAYKRGLCSMCGKKMLDTSSYRQSR